MFVASQMSAESVIEPSVELWIVTIGFGLPLIVPGVMPVPLRVNSASVSRIDA